ncbi:hypothetical protein [Collimonas fungivorans]|uniref:hypothetical protein n=1 Tax=Collimonas fungivorans TaxID=158899 RepID=UPI0012370B2B|nr:hypothetical protein [Collimonas fungivorans]
MRSQFDDFRLQGDIQEWKNTLLREEYPEKQKTPEFASRYKSNYDCPAWKDSRNMPPGHQDPEAVMMIADQPIASNEKLVRRWPTLLQWGTTCYAPPHTRSTDAHVTISRRGLASECIGLLDTIFVPKGLSLLVTQPETQIQVRFKAEAPLRLTIEMPTITKLNRQLAITTGDRPTRQKTSRAR